MKRLIVTGTRHGWDDTALLDAGLFAAYQVLNPGNYGNPVLLVHGAARGIDTQARIIWKTHGFPTEAHPADWKKHGPAAGPIRNQAMVDAGADLCVAFPDPNGESKGTWDCVNRCRIAGITVLVCGDAEEPR